MSRGQVKGQVKGQDDEVLLDYLATLLMDDESDQQPTAAPLVTESAFGADDFPMTCLAAKVGDMQILVPISQVAGMQALAGPLYESAPWQGLPAYLPTAHGQMPLLDVAAVLGLVPADYLASTWRGHLLKIKDLDKGILVDTILGPVQQAQVPASDKVQRLPWGDIADLEAGASWLIANLKG